MGKKSIRIKRATAIIAHPEDPQLRVVLEEPSRSDYLEWRRMIQEYTETQVAINPLTREPIYRDDGQLETIITAPRVPAEKLEEYLAKHIISVTGIKEEDASKRDIIKAFFERPFDCHGIEKEMDEIKFENGKRIVTKAMKKTDPSFAIYLLDRLHEEATFQRPDPLAPSSDVPSSNE